MKKIDARKLSRETQDQMRRLAMNLREQRELTWQEVADVLGVHLSTVLAWSKRYSEQGSEGLKSRTRGRRQASGRTLTLAQEWQLRSILVGQTPNQLQLDFALWNRRAVMQLIKHLYGVEMPIRTVGQYLQRWGYTPQRPTRQALEQNPEAIEHWLEETYPAIVARAKAENATIYWGDETAVAEDGHWIRGYAPAGVTPVLVADSDRKIFLILDNLRVHHARLVREWLEGHKEEIEAFYLPPYSPECNPDEYLNRDLKTRLRTSDRARNKSELLEKAEAFMSWLAKTPERVVAYFQHASVRYAT
ncbi:IS630 family transposase [Azotobacter beijerinckii]|nr:IS630 family transposase [Azotobacter beijerinckii]